MERALTCNWPGEVFVSTLSDSQVGFSQISKKKKRRGALPFWHTCSYISFAHVVNISDQGLSRSGHQVTSSDLTSKQNKFDCSS